MPKLRFAQFSGEIPKLIPRLLPDTGAQYAENVRLDDGGLTPIRKSKRVGSAGMTDARTIYYWNGTWLAWNKVVNVAPAPVATDRLYYTGDGVPKMRVGSTVYNLKVPYPTAALTASVTGVGSGSITTRLYVYTFVTDYGEESEPCPISADVNWQAGQTVTLSGFQAPPAGRAISKQRIYRSQSSNQAGTDLFLIEERTASASNYTDTHAPDDFQEVLPSRDYNQPPDDLQGLIQLPNGMMAGFTGKQLCFSEPYRPHAWPEKYRMTASFDIVALAAYGTTVVAGTKGYPFVASGNSPESMLQEKIEVNLPCINASGMVDLGYSVAYPSNDGLVVVSNGGATVASDALFTRADWQRLSPLNIVAAQYSGRYFASFLYVDIDGTTKTEGTVIIDLTGQQPFVLRAAFRAEAFFYDTSSGKLYYSITGEIYEFDALGETNEIMTWKSKRVILPAPVTMGAILVESGELETPEQAQARRDQIAAINAANAALFAQASMGSEVDGSAFDLLAMNADGLQSIPVGKYTSVRVYADGELIKTIGQLDQVKRIPPRMARVWEIQVNGTAEVEQVTLATTVRELTEE